MSFVTCEVSVLWLVVESELESDAKGVFWDMPEIMIVSSTSGLSSSRRFPR